MLLFWKSNGKKSIPFSESIQEIKIMHHKVLLEKKKKWITPKRNKTTIKTQNNILLPRMRINHNNKWRCSIHIFTFWEISLGPGQAQK